MYSSSVWKKKQNIQKNIIYIYLSLDRFELIEIEFERSRLRYRANRERGR